MTSDTMLVSTGSTQRRWSRRLRRWRPWLIGVVVVAALVFGAWAVLVSPWLGVRTVNIVGVSGTPKDQVAAAAHLAAGTPLARVDLAGLRARVESIPTVASVTVTRDWPHTVDILVTERRPVATVFRDGSWRLMDGTGLLYRTTPSRDPKLPIVELDGSPSQQTMPEVAAALKRMPPDLLAGMRRVRAASMDSITLLLKDGREVQWGSAALSEQKVQVARLLLHTTKAQVINVSVPSQPATRD